MDANWRKWIGLTMVYGPVVGGALWVGKINDVPLSVMLTYLALLACIAAGIWLYVTSDDY